MRTKLYVCRFTLSWDIRGTLKILGVTWPRTCPIFGKNIRFFSLVPAKTCAKFLVYSFIRSKDITPNRMRVLPAKCMKCTQKSCYWGFVTSVRLWQREFDLACPKHSKLSLILNLQTNDDKLSVVKEWHVYFSVTFNVLAVNKHKRVHSTSE